MTPQQLTNSKPAPKRFAAPQRFLHWFMAACILSMLFIGVGMVSTVSTKYLTLFQIHKFLGIAILVLAILRLAFRVLYGSPRLPSDLPTPMRLAAEASQVIFYLLMLAMPLLGWGMLSSASHPVIFYGTLHLPPILPVNPATFALLRIAHTYLAFAFFALILAHMAALLFHKFVRKDGVFETMAPVLTANQAEELNSKHL
jgi:cytochrome b561